MWHSGVSVANITMKAGAGAWLNDFLYTILYWLAHRHKRARVAYDAVCKSGYHAMITQLHGWGEVEALSASGRPCAPEHIGNMAE